MNRAAIAATLLLPWIIAIGTPAPAWGLVTETPEEKQERIDKFQDLRLIYELGGSPGPDEVLKSRVLRQGPDRIYDVDFVELMNDPTLTRYWETERNKDFAIWLGTGLAGMPLGGILFIQNFRGDGPLAVFADQNRAQTGNVSDWRGYSLSVLGGTLAIYGAYTFSLWLREMLDLDHPDRLDAAALEPRIRDWNDQLRDRLNLEPEDIPSPPTPRPSPSPSPSPSDVAFPPPAAPVEDDDAYGTPPPGMPIPLPVLTPGALPSALVPTERPRPDIFRFPGRWTTETPLPSPTSGPSAKPSSTPLPVARSNQAPHPPDLRPHRPRNELI